MINWYESLHGKPEKLKKPKKPKNPKIVTGEKVTVLEEANVQAIGGGGGKDRSKPKAESERFEVKFTDADRDEVYLRMHEERSKRALANEAAERESLSNTPIPERMTFERFREKAKLVLGDQYSEEIVCVVFAQEYFDPKIASAFEKSKCLSHYRAFKSRHDVREDVVFGEERGRMVELVNPFEAIDAQPKQKRKISVNLLSAKHEFLFMRGLWTWRKQLEKTEAVHVHIFEDCLRLSCIRFYNSIFRYHWETKKLHLEDFSGSITVNDLDAGQIRNVLVHNFPSPKEMEMDAEEFLFPLGERVLELCHKNPLPPSTINLEKSCFFGREVKQWNRDVDGTSCRENIFACLRRIAMYTNMLESKQDLGQSSQLLNVLSMDWDLITPALQIWVHPARALESCILQVGEFSRGANKFMSQAVRNYVSLCREVRSVGYHDNNSDEEWNYDPLSPSFLASMIEGARKFNVLR